MGFLNRWRFAGRSPLAIIEVIIGFAAIVGGLYVISPLLPASVLPPAGVSEVVDAAASTIGILLLGIVAIVSGLLIVGGNLVRNFHYRSAGLFIQILLRLYTLLVTIMAYGLFPLTWLSNAALLLICIVCWLYVRGLVPRKENHKWRLTQPGLH